MFFFSRFFLSVPFALYGQQIGMGAGGDAAEDRVRGRHIQTGHAGEQGTRETERKRSLAHTLRALDQPCMVQALPGQRVFHRAFSRPMTEQTRRLPR